MSFLNDGFHRFLRELGVEYGTDAPSPSSKDRDGADDPFRLLQLDQKHDAFYLLDLMETSLELRVFVVCEHGPLKCDVYLVRPGLSHPLAPTLFAQLKGYQGSLAFEAQREDLLWQQLFALGESLKRCFWAGYATMSFPPEITVEQVA